MCRRERGEMKWELLNTPIPPFHFQRSRFLDHTSSSFTGRDVGKILESMEFQSCEINFRTENFLPTADPQITMHWIKEVEIAKSIHNLLTSRSITGQQFSWFRYAWFDDCVSLEVLYQHAVTFSEKSQCRRAACAQTRTILTRKTSLARVFPAQPKHMKPYKDSLTWSS